jgi:hypothetical protein
MRPTTRELTRRGGCGLGSSVAHVEACAGWAGGLSGRRLSAEKAGCAGEGGQWAHTGPAAKGRSGGDWCNSLQRHMGRWHVAERTQSGAAWSWRGAVAHAAGAGAGVDWRSDARLGKTAAEADGWGRHSVGHG